MRRIDARGDGLNISLLIAALITAFAPIAQALSDSQPVTPSQWVCAGLSTLLALAAGNIAPKPRGPTPDPRKRRTLEPRR